MLLIINNLPPGYNYKDIRNLIEEKCGIYSIILDNLIAEGQSSRVTVGLPDEHQAAILINNLSGAMINGYQLYVKDIRNNSVSPQQYRNTQDQSKYPFNHDFSHEARNDMQLSYDAPMPLLTPTVQESIPAKPILYQGMNIYNRQGNQENLVNQSKFIGLNSNQSNERLYFQQQIPYLQPPNNNMNYSSDRNSYLAIKNETSSTNDHFVSTAFDSGRDRDRSSRSEHRDFDRRSYHNNRRPIDRSRSPQKIQHNEPRERDDYSQYRRDVKYRNDIDQRSHNSPPRLTTLLNYTSNTSYDYAEPNKSYTKSQFNENTNRVESVSSYRLNQKSTQSYEPKKQTETIKESSTWNQTIIYGNQTSNVPHTSFKEESFEQNYRKNNDVPNVSPFSDRIRKLTNTLQVIQQRKRNQGNVPKTIPAAKPGVYNQGNVPKMVPAPEPHVYNQGNVPKMVPPPKPRVYSQGNVPKMVPPPKPHVYNQGNVPKMFPPPKPRVSKMIPAPKPNVHNQGNVPKMVPPPKPPVRNQRNVSKMIPAPKPNVHNQGNVSKMGCQPRPDMCNQRNVPTTKQQSKPKVYNPVPEIVGQPNVVDQRNTELFNKQCTLATSEIIKRLKLNLDKEPEEYRKIFMHILNSAIKHRVFISCKNELITSKDEIMARYYKIFSKQKTAKRLNRTHMQARFQYDLERLGAIKDDGMLKATKTNNQTPKSNSEFIAIQKTVQEILMKQAKESSYMEIIRTKYMGLSYFIAAEMYYLEHFGIDIQEASKTDTLSLFLTTTNPFNIVEIHACSEYPTHAELETHLKPFNVLGIRKFWVKNIYLAATKFFADVKILKNLKCITVGNKTLIIREFLQREFITKNKITYYPPQDASKLTSDQRSTLDHHSDLLSIEMNKACVEQAKMKLEKKMAEPEKLLATKQLKATQNAQVTPNKPNADQHAANNKNTENKHVTNEHITADKVMFANVETKSQQEIQHDNDDDHVEEVDFDELEDY